jgi:alpha-N-arabinofuranosidase
VNPRFFWSATVSTKDKVLHLKLVNASNKPQALTLELSGAKAGAAAMYTLHAASWWATNSMEHPDAIRPVASRLLIGGKKMNHPVAANTIEVIDIPLK